MIVRCAWGAKLELGGAKDPPLVAPMVGRRYSVLSIHRIPTVPL